MLAEDSQHRNEGLPRACERDNTCTNVQLATLARTHDGPWEEIRPSLEDFAPAPCSSNPLSTMFACSLQVYGATKAAVDFLVRATHGQYSMFGIRCYGINPFYTNTPMLASAGPASLADMFVRPPEPEPAC